MIQQEVHKWITTNTYVDIDTGECIREYQIENNEYYIVRKTKQHEFTEETRHGRVLKYGHRNNTIECRTTGQLKLL